MVISEAASPLMSVEFSTVTGTQSLEFYGLPATGQQITYETARLFTLRNDLIAHERAQGGVLGEIQRLRRRGSMVSP